MHLRPNISLYPVKKVIPVVALALLTCILFIIVNYISSPLKPNSGRDANIIAIKYKASIHKVE
jgi:hypothetical protein